MNLWGEKNKIAPMVFEPVLFDICSASRPLPTPFAAQILFLRYSRKRSCIVRPGGEFKCSPPLHPILKLYLCFVSLVLLLLLLLL